jgi:hypothetical protein
MIDRSIDQSIDQSINRSIDQSINRSIDQSINRSKSYTFNEVPVANGKYRPNANETLVAAGWGRTLVAAGWGRTLVAAGWGSRHLVTLSEPPTASPVNSDVSPVNPRSGSRASSEQSTVSSLQSVGGV